MGRKTIDRTGEKGVNNFGSEMVIVEYRKWDDKKIWDEVTKYTSCAELIENCRGAYRAAEKWGILDKVKEYYKSI